jgi:Tol biopolymer transport system component
MDALAGEQSRLSSDNTFKGLDLVKKIGVLVILGLMLLVISTSWGRTNGPVRSGLGGPIVGGSIAYVRGGAIWIYSGGQSKQLTTGPKDARDKRDAFPAFSPDGTELVYTRIDEGFSDLYKVSLDDPKDITALTDNRPNVPVGQVEQPGVTDGYNTEALWADYPAWSPDGEEIAFTSDVGTEYPNLRVIRPNQSIGEGSEKLAGGLDFSVQTVEHLSWSPTGKKIVAANYVTDGRVGQIWSYDISGERWTALTNSKDGAYDPAWSPDGQWIAFAMREGTATNIYVVNTDASTWTGDYPTPVQLTVDGNSRSPAWSPDGSQLAYLTLKDISFDLYAAGFAMDANGAPVVGQAQKLTDNVRIDAPSGISWGR